MARNYVGSEDEEESDNKQSHPKGGRNSGPKKGSKARNKNTSSGDEEAARTALTEGSETGDG